MIIPDGCKEFNFDEMMKGAKVVARNGSPFIFGAYNPNAEDGCQIVGWLECGQIITSNLNGCFWEQANSVYDLFIVQKPKKKFHVTIEWGARNCEYMVFNTYNEVFDYILKFVENGKLIVDLKVFKIEMV